MENGLAVVNAELGDTNERRKRRGDPRTMVASAMTLTGAAA
jgi:hypothetical protein